MSIDSLARKFFRRFWLPYLAPQHITLFSRQSLAAALGEAGFEDVRVHDSYAPLVWTISFMIFRQPLSVGAECDP